MESGRRQGLFRAYHLCHHWYEYKATRLGEITKAVHVETGERRHPRIERGGTSMLREREKVPEKESCEGDARLVGREST